MMEPSESLIIEALKHLNAVSTILWTTKVNGYPTSIMFEDMGRAWEDGADVTLNVGQVLVYLKGKIAQALGGIVKVKVGELFDTQEGAK